MDQYHYGMWGVVIANALFFLFFALSFLAPRGKFEWRSMGVFTAFIVALFTEMYGFPLTVFILTSLLGSKYPALDPFSHKSGHLLLTFLGGGGVMLAVIHLISNGLMLLGFFIMGMGWRKIHSAQAGLVTDGIYKWVRHPQYVGLFLVSVGLLIQWPTIATLASWPILMGTYYKLAKREEREMEMRFGEHYLNYKKRVPGFFPFLFNNGAGEVFS
ncbi:MAG: isoprenylcysteine carboxylmethyltransferase family protein [Thermodesulfobacteriota bacterium]